GRAHEVEAAVAAAQVEPRAVRDREALQLGRVDDPALGDGERQRERLRSLRERRLALGDVCIGGRASARREGSPHATRGYGYEEASVHHVATCVHPTCRESFLAVACGSSGVAGA